MPNSLNVEEERELEAYLRALLTYQNDDSVMQALSDLEVPSPYRVRIKVVYSPDSPTAVFEKLAENGEIQSLTSKVHTYVYESTVGRKQPQDIRALFHIGSFDNSVSQKVKAIISICKNDQWGILRRYIKKNYPRLVPILLSQAELIQGAKALKKITGHQVYVRSFSAKETLPSEDGKRSKSIREWTQEELDTALLSIQDRHQMITSLEVDFLPRLGEAVHVQPKASCKIRKTSEIEVTGSFNLVYKAVAEYIAQVGERKLLFFSGRGLRESRYKPQPLSIDFSRPVFDDVQVVRNLVSILRKYPRSVYAVEHGNPYAHVKIADLFDGSSFDVWAMPPSRLALMPGLKASEAGFERLVHYIFDAFREGKLTEYGREKHTA